MYSKLISITILSIILNKSTIVIPGLDEKDQFDSYSGYIKVKDTNRNIFYWHIPALTDAASKPLIWWSNGGPGCSGLGGMISEMGPIRVQKDLTLKRNPNTWNNEANIVYVEQPAGVGFSYIDNGESLDEYTDDLAAEDNLKFILQFLEENPEYKDRDFYVASESYGGHYIPTLTKKILDYLKENIGALKFRGFMLGNPYTNPSEQQFGMVSHFHGSSLITEEMYKQYIDNCYDNETDRCSSVVSKISEVTKDIYIYGTEFPVCPTDPLRLSASVLRLGASLSSSGKPKLEPLPYLFCEDDYMTKYMNREDVKAALGVHSRAQEWGICTNSVGSAWSEDSRNEDMAAVHKYIAENHSHVPGFKALIYSGDNDAICSTLGTMSWLTPTFADNVQDEWFSWKYDSNRFGTQVGGFGVNYDNDYMLRTVHGAGHMVPATQAERATALIDNFLKMQNQYLKTQYENLYE